MDTNKYVLNKEEGINYLTRIYNLLPPKCGLKNLIQEDMNFLKSLKMSLMVCPINPLNGFPSVGTLVADSNAGKDIEKQKLFSFPGLCDLLKSNYSVEDVGRIYNKTEVGDVKTELFSVFDNDIKLSFTFFAKEYFKGLESDILFISKTHDISSDNSNRYKFILESNAPDNFSSKVKELENNMGILERLCTENISKNFMQSVYDFPLIDILNNRSDVFFKYLGHVLDYARLVNSNRSEFISKEHIENTIRLREDSKVALPLFFEKTLTDAFLNNLATYNKID